MSENELDSLMRRADMARKEAKAAYDPDEAHRCARCGDIELIDELGQSVCEGCRRCSLCCECGTFDDEEEA